MPPVVESKMWLRTATPRELKAVAAAFGGYGVDAFDFMVYTFVIPTLIVAWHMSSAQAGWIATAALLASAVGGWVAGIAADRFGRVRVLQLTVLCFTVFTALSGLTSSFEQLLVTRSLQGFGFGGEWSVGSILVSEVIRPQHRGKAVGLVQSSWAVGWGLAAVTYAATFTFVSPDLGWRIMFWLGILPALLIIFIRRQVEEPEIFVKTRKEAEKDRAATSFLIIFRPAYLKTTLLATLLSTGMMGAYYSVTTWLPTFFKTERHLSVLNTGGYLLVLIFGSFCGYVTSAYLNDKLGRRNCFILFALSAGLLILAYTRIPVNNQTMLALGFPLGFFLSGIFSGMGAFLSELFPTAIRGSGQGFCYNAGRAIGAFCPALVGYYAKVIPLGEAIGIVASIGYLIVVVAALLLPETRGRMLDADSAAAEPRFAGVPESV